MEVTAASILSSLNLRWKTRAFVYKKVSTIRAVIRDESSNPHRDSRGFSSNDH